MKRSITPYEALLLAIDKLGSNSAMARVCGLSPTAVWKWVQVSKRLPAEHVLVVEKATGVSRHALRPDIYPKEIDLALPHSAIGEPFVECGPILSARTMARHAKKHRNLPSASALG